MKTYQSYMIVVDCVGVCVSLANFKPGLHITRKDINRMFENSIYFLSCIISDQSWTCPLSESLFSAKIPEQGLKSKRC